MRNPLKAVLLLTLLLVAGAGVFKLYYQKEHRPAYADKPEHQCNGFVSIDNYGNRANLLAQCFREGGQRWTELEEHLAESLHPTTLLIPGIVALLGCVYENIPFWFALLSIAAYLGTIALVFWAALQLFKPDKGNGAFVAAILAGGHLTFVRTAAQLNMDPFCCLWITATICVAWAHIRHRRVWTTPLLVFLIVTSLFIKVSCLPVLAIVPLFSFITSRSLKPNGHLRPVLWFTVIPLLLTGLLIMALGVENAFLGDIKHLAKEYTFGNSHFAHFALEMAFLGQFAWLLLFRRPLATVSVESNFYRCLLGALILFLVCTIGFKCPPIPRLYLPLVPILGLLAAPHLKSLVRPSWVTALLLIYVGGNTGLGVIGLLLM